MSVDEEVQRINERKVAEMLRLRSKAGEGRPASSGKPVELTDANFGEVVRGRPLVVVDFWAPWCGPCRAVSPVLEQLASEMAGEATFGKLNVDENPATSQLFGIRSIPTILVFKEGQPVDGLVGVAPKEAIAARIRAHTAGGRETPYR